MYTSAFTVCSSLEKIFSHDEILPAATDSISLIRGEEVGFGAAVYSSDSETVEIEIASPFKTDIYRVTEIQSDFPLYEDRGSELVLNDAKPGLYPDLLTPSDGRESKDENSTLAFYVRFTAGDVPAGQHDITVTIKTEKQTQVFTVKAKLYEVTAQKQILRHMNWFHCDCLATYYNVEVFSEKHWEIIENFARNAFAHGVNVLFTPLFTPPLDTAEGGERPTVQLVRVKKNRLCYTFDFSLLDRWMDMASRIGFEYFEFSHLFTQWGAKHAPKIVADTLQGERKIFGWDTKADDPEYVNFLSQFGAALTKYTDDRGITQNCYVHCSDEPGLSDILKYRKSAELVKEHFGSYRHIDALSDYAFYKSGLIDLPVPSINSIDKFAGKVPELWTYYCCGGFRDNTPNRFFCLPSIKTRILGTILYKYDCAGFLQWGFNFYYTQFSKEPVDPFKVTDAGGAFPSGDAFVVYPGADGKPMSSLRQKTFAEGVRDYEALKQLEALSSREEVLALIKKYMGEVAVTSYPLDGSVLLAMMDEVYAKTEELLK